MIRLAQPQNVKTEYSIKGTTWRHPQVPSIKVPRRTAAAIAVMEAGITDYETIGSAVGLTSDEVERIDLAIDTATRQLGIKGIPDGVFFDLRNKIRCPGCAAWITIAPCVACCMQKARARERAVGRATV